jgi:hypothetical protein
MPSINVPAQSFSVGAVNYSDLTWLFPVSLFKVTDITSSLEKDQARKSLALAELDMCLLCEAGFIID